MTRIQPGRPLRRQTDALCSHFPIVIELHPKHLTLRLKGQRQAYDITYERLIWHAFKLAAADRRHQQQVDRRLRRIA